MTQDRNIMRDVSKIQDYEKKGYKDSRKGLGIIVYKNSTFRISFQELHFFFFAELSVETSNRKNVTTYIIICQNMMY